MTTSISIEIGKLMRCAVNSETTIGEKGEGSLKEKCKELIRKLRLLNIELHLDEIKDGFFRQSRFEKPNKDTLALYKKTLSEVYYVVTPLPVGTIIKTDSSNNWIIAGNDIECDNTCDDLSNLNYYLISEEKYKSGDYTLEKCYMSGYDEVHTQEYILPQTS